MTFLLINSQINFNFDCMIKKNHNKNLHSINGNIPTKNNYQLLHWNKGNSDFHNKINDVLLTIDEHSPDLFSISEANYNFSNPIQIKGYNIEVNRLHTFSSFSRSILLIRDNISYKRRNDLENTFISSVWIEVIVSSK